MKNMREKVKPKFLSEGIFLSLRFTKVFLIP